MAENRILPPGQAGPDAARHAVAAHAGEDAWRYAVPCPACRAEQGRPCIGSDGLARITRHAVRADAAVEARAEDLARAARSGETR